jgi:hypothetical protein
VVVAVEVDVECVTDSAEGLEGASKDTTDAEGLEGR